MKKFVVMSGGFHPFHAGHASLYQQAKEKFPDATVLVCATNVQSDRPFPFSLKKKLAQLSGVPPKDFIEVGRQFSIEDPGLANRIGDPSKAVVIFVRSDKDKNEPPIPWRLGPDGKPPVGKKGQPLSNRLLDYPGDGQQLYPASKHVYMAYLKTVEFGPGITSATKIREMWPTLNDKRKTALVMSLYPAAQKNPKLAQTVVGMFDQVMGGQEGVSEALDEAVGGNYLYHATSANGLKGMLSSGSIRSATGPQAATSAQTKLPTVSVTRDWGYASGTNAQQQMVSIGRDAVLVLDRNAVESNFKTLGTSQSTNIKGLAFNPYLKKDGEARSQNTDPMARNIAKGKAKNAEPTSKAGGEFEEAVVVPKGALPLKGTMVGFWVNPNSQLMKDPTIMNDPRRLNMVRPNQFVKAAGQQGVEESEEALQFATQAHAGQTRAGGEPYVNHPIRVADSIKRYKQSHNLDALINAALLHDTVEDTDTTHEALHDLFGGLVASLVKELTSDPEQIKKMGKAQYLAHKMAAMSSYALVIKLADRLDNVKDITTARTPEWRQKYKNETEHILNYIEKTRALSDTHKVFIDLIRNKIAELDNTNVDEGWKEKLGAAALAGAMATPASGITLNPNRIIDAHGRSAANPYGNVDSMGNPIKKPAPKPEDDAWAKIEKRKAAEKLKEFSLDKRDDSDVELQQLMRKAQQHYPNMPNKQQAFIKFVQRALRHSEEEDTQQDIEINNLKQEVGKLQKDHAKIMKVAESTDYLEEK